MAITKIIEICGSSSDGFEDAIKQGIETASKTVENFGAVWIKEQKVVVDAGKITEYRIYLNIAAVLDLGTEEVADAHAASAGD